jgi:PAS domain S-box-containing protein
MIHQKQRTRVIFMSDTEQDAKESAPTSDVLDPASRASPFPVVGIAASTDGLEALEALLTAMPTDTGMGFVIVQQVSLERQNGLVKTLVHATRMKVHEAVDGQKVSADEVYVLTPGACWYLAEGVLRHQAHEHDNLSPGIDEFLRSLAEDCGHKAIGVLMAGALEDGTMGLEEIKGRGGVTFAQTEGARHDNLSCSVSTSACVDFVLTPREIAEEITRIARHPYVAPPTRVEAASKLDHGRIAQIIRRTMGVDFSHYKSSTMHRRIARRMLLNKVASLGEYEELISHSPGEMEALYQDMLIGVTSFFRDPEFFEALKNHVFPQLLVGRTNDEPLRIWCLGCSTGEEAYSLTMALAECAEDSDHPLPVQVFASDLNSTAVDRARIGLYPPSIAHDISPERLERFFVRENEGYRICKAIRERCIFAQHNALADPPFSRVDMVSCRNMLIYLEPVLQQQILKTLHFALKPGGWLWLGSSESIGSSRSFFDVVDAGKKLFKRRPGPAQNLRPMLDEQGYTPPSSRGSREGPQNELHREAERLLASKYAPPGVVITTGLEIVQFRGETGPYLAPASGMASLQLLKMLRDGLMAAVHTAIQKSGEESRSLREEGLHVRTESGFRELAIEVIPIKTGAAKVSGFIVLFDEGERPVQQSAWALLPPPGDGAAEVVRLTQELAATRDLLQSLTEQQDATSEELQSANEEAQSSNEELQTLNEELESSKEELQSANEELTSVNDELHVRNGELHKLNSELRRSRDYAETIVASVRVPLLVLDGDLHIKTASQAFYNCFLLTPETTIDQSIFKIANGEWDIPELRNLLEQALPRETSIDHFEVRHRFENLGSRVMLLRACRLPQRAMNRELVVLSIEDITERTLAEAALMESEGFNRSIVESSRDCIKILGLDGTLLMMTEGGRKMLCIENLADYIGKLWIDFWHGPDRDSARTAVERAAAGGIGQFLGMKARDDGETRWWDVLITPVRDANGAVNRLLAVSRDVTDRRRSELNNALLASISEEISLLTEVSEILHAVGVKLGSHLELTTCVFVEVDEAAKMVEVTHEWRQDCAPPTVGKYRLDDFFTEEFQNSCHVGETFVVDDTASDPRTDSERFAELNIGSFISVPMLRGGAWRYSLSVHRSSSAVWREDEIDVVKELAPRVLAHLERVRVEELSSHLSAIVEYSEDAIISKDLNGIIKSWNRGAEKVFGYTAHEAVGQLISLLIPEDRANEEILVIGGIRRGETIEHYETKRRIKNGRLIDVSLTVSPIFNIRGEVVGASKIARDITERKRTEQALSESEAHFRTMANAINQLAWTANPDGYITWYNQSWYDYTGTTPEQMEGWGWQSVHDPHELPRVLENWSGSIQTREPFEMTFPLRSAEGVFRQFLTRAIPLKNAEGELTQWFGTNTDVDKIARDEQALRESNQRMTLAIESTGVGIWEWNVLSNRILWDAEMFRIYGVVPTEDCWVPYSLWQASVHPDDFKEQEELLKETLAGRNPGVREFRIKKADTSEWRYLQLVDTIRHNSKGEPEWIVGSNLDVTEKRRANLNDSFLALISEDLLRISGVDHLMRSLGEKLIGHLNLTGCTLVKVDESSDQLEVTHNSHRPNTPNLLGTYSLSSFLSPAFIQSALTGETLIVRDIHTDPRAASEKHAQLGIGSFVTVPLIRNGKLSYLFTIYQSTPQDWREDEVELLQEVVTRLWTRLERSRAEDALARAMVESEQQRRLYHTMLSSTPDFIYVFDLNHRFAYINDALLKVYGMTWEEAKGRDWVGLGYEQWHADMHDREIDQVIATKAPIRGEIPFNGATGRRVYDYIFTPVFDKNGEVEAVAGTTRDITERKQIESSQAAERKIFERIATGGTLGEILETLLLETEAQSEEGMLCSILILDKTRRFLLHGAAPSLPESYNQKIHQLAIGPNVGSCGTAAFQGKSVFVEDISSDPRWENFRDLAAEHRLSACCSMPIFSLEGQVLGTIAMYYPHPLNPGEHDTKLIETAKRLAAIIIERKQAEEALAEQTASLVGAARSKDEFLAMLAHELRNPLAPIRNATEILQNPAASAADRDRAQQLIARQTENMSRMLDDLLDVSRITEGKIDLRRKTVELQSILAAAAEVARPACLNNGQQLTISLSEEPVFLDADATRLEQLFGNLLSNACKYSGNGSHIHLSAEILDGREAEIRISDNGIGIDPEVLPSIFDLFVQSSRTLDRSHGGLGIGLTIVDRLVKLHGGSIKAHSAGLGHGCEFIVRLPLMTSSCSIQPVEMKNQPENRSLRMLVVDDNYDAAETMAMLQQLRGHDTRTAHTGPDAVTAAGEFLPQVVLLDIGLPEMDGYEVARKIRTIPGMGEAFLVALTGYSTENDREKARAAGFNEHLAKPADLELLREWLGTRV